MISEEIISLMVTGYHPFTLRIFHTKRETVVRSVSLKRYGFPVFG